jgi:hypothetical protein
LVEPALATARKYRWQPDADAPETQIGFITVNFKLESNLFLNYHTHKYKKSMLNKMNQETTDWMFNQLPMYQLQGASAYKKDLTNTHFNRSS